MAETGTDEVGQNYIIRIGPKRNERKAPEANPVASLGRLLFTSCVIRDSPFLPTRPSHSHPLSSAAV